MKKVRVMCGTDVFTITVVIRQVNVAEKIERQKKRFIICYETNSFVETCLEWNVSFGKWVMILI